MTVASCLAWMLDCALYLPSLDDRGNLACKKLMTSHIYHVTAASVIYHLTASVVFGNQLPLNLCCLLGSNALEGPSPTMRWRTWVLQSRTT